MTVVSSLVPAVPMLVRAVTVVSLLVATVVLVSLLGVMVAVVSLLGAIAVGLFVSVKKTIYFILFLKERKQRNDALIK